MYLLHRTFLIVMWAIQSHNAKLVLLIFITFLSVIEDCIN